MSTDDTVKAVKRDGQLYREFPDGRMELMAVAASEPRSEADIEAGALADPDNPPSSSYATGRLKARPRVFVIRRALKMTQQEFAEAFQIPIGDVVAWENGAAPGHGAQAYLEVIAHDPDHVRRALAGRQLPIKAAE